MNLTEKQIEDLVKLWAKKEYITIKGVNNFGEEFETTGRITTTDKGKHSVYPEGIYVEFGQSKDNPQRKQTNFFGLFEFSVPSESVYGNSLHVLSIEHNGKVLYENEDKDKIIEVTAKNDKLERQKAEKAGKDIQPDCPVVNKLKTMIGKPIVLDGKSGILCHSRGLSNSGAAIVDLLSGPGICNAFVKSESKLYTETNDGKIELLAENNTLDYIDSMFAVYARMNEKADGLER